mgnify:FL=1
MKKHILTLILASIIGILLIAMIVKRVVTSPYKIAVSDQVEMIDSEAFQFSLAEYHTALQLQTTNILLIDVRSEAEYNKGHLPNVVNVPLAKLMNEEYTEYINNGDRLTKVLYADSEVEATNALSILLLNGINVNFKYLRGSYSIAQQYIVLQPTPSYFFFSDEQAKYNFTQLMPTGSASVNTTTNQEVKVDLNTPRGGC